MEVLHILPAQNEEMHLINEDPDSCPCCPCVVAEGCTLKAYHNNFLPLDGLIVIEKQFCNQN